tara:strand:+ start:477 stop:653 length:177 start_codon:yes stop_codon:yes gene_type:complete
MARALAEMHEDIKYLKMCNLFFGKQGNRDTKETFGTTLTLVGMNCLKNINANELEYEF